MIALSAENRELAAVAAGDEPVTQRAVLDALEAAYPVLRGTIRDLASHQRRSLVRLFARERDLCHDSTDDPLPDPVTTGSEPYIVVGAMSGG